MTNTNNLNVTLLEQSQAQKEVTINEAIYALEALQNMGVESRVISTPSISPSAGDSYIVASLATDDWAGHENEIAYFNQVWNFISPKEGLFLWVKDEAKLCYFDGSAWQEYADNLQNISLLGVNASADTTNKFVVSSDAILLNNNGSNIQAKINKNSASDTASFLFQNGFSGRAEIGLTGDDDFHFKVSSDGSSFIDAITLDKDNGSLTIAGGAKIISGTGTPESVITAPVGSMFLRVDGGASTTLYIKESGTGSAGWIAK